MANIADVARRAGVATSTVSHVINRTRVVSPATTRAVEEAVAAVGYTPNVLARALARSVTNTVGLAISTSRNRYFGDVANAVEGEVWDIGYLGDWTVYRVKLASGAILRVSCANASRFVEHPITWDEPVHLTFAPDAGVILTA